MWWGQPSWHTADLICQHVLNALRWHRGTLHSSMHISHPPKPIPQSSLGPICYTLVKNFIMVTTSKRLPRNVTYTEGRQALSTLSASAVHNSCIALQIKVLRPRGSYHGGSCRIVHLRLLTLRCSLR